MKEKKIRVMFVCTGNICRSPMAEAIFQHMVREAGLEDRFEIRSAGTSTYHLGERPHAGTQKVLRQYKVRLDPSKRAERIDTEVLEEIDYIIAMDAGHAAALRKHTNVYRLLEFALQTGVSDVPDPYYENNFDEVYQLVTAGCQGLLDFIREREAL